MMLFLFYAFLAYLLYRLVFGFIIPVVRATRRVKKNFRDMQDRMQAQYGQQPGHAYNGHSQEAAASSRKNDEDYIEFEEVK